MIQLWPESLGGLIRYDLDHLHHMEGYDAMHHKILLFGTAAWVVGLFAAFFFYRPGAKEDRLAQQLPAVYNFLKARLWFDEIYGFYVSKIQDRFAAILGFLDIFLIKGLLVRGSAGLVALLGFGARALHVGNVHAYVYWFLGGLLLFWAFAGGLL
jgi:NADH-quinone oxidoreductase subunit L